MPVISYAGKVNAPDFPKGLEWLNTEHPLSLRELKGKVVLLDFWTYCCINCIHVIPDLKRLEAKYRSELVVIGVHSGKFSTERETANIREAILRYGIDHPVVNDRSFEVWDAYTVNAWPSFILIDPEGKVVGKHSGEDIFDIFDRVIRGMIREFDMFGKIDRQPLSFVSEQQRAPRSLLSFPGKVASDGTHLYIADSNHNRIVVVALADHSVADTIGDGTEGLADGSCENARFSRPQGIAVSGQVLYVADTGNHAVRAVDLAKRKVVTLAGTGRQARRFNVSGKGTAVELNSPWDLVVHNGILYIAMAGPHQLWTLDPETGWARPHAGSGREGLIDGPLAEAVLAQPSGITTDGRRLYFADSEASAVRAADPDAGGMVETFVGEGLFEFGDRDGVGTEARLQHPLGVLSHEGVLYVADTYNNKIKRIDPASRRCETVIGAGRQGMTDGPAGTAELNEPNGLTQAHGKLYIADTNNHLIRIFDLAAQELSTMSLQHADALLPPQRKRDPFEGKRVELPEQTVAAGAGAIELTVLFPEGLKLSAMAPFSFRCSFEDGSAVRMAPGVADQTLPHPVFPLSLPVAFSPGAVQGAIDLIVYYCQAGREYLCFIKHLRAIVPVRVVEEGGARTVRVEVAIDAAA
ncbi:MAG: thioredoxin-like domain-containing protein [Nitrospirota bacterium]